jgi:hypothetical protein
LAEVVLKKHDAEEGRLKELAMRVLARPFRAEELPIVKASLAELLGHYQAHTEEAGQLIAVGESKSDESLEASQLAAWTMLANEVLNLDEVLNK